MTKCCSCCGRWFKLSAFYRDSNAKDGRSCHCKVCVKKRARAWQAKPANKKRHTLTNALWRAANPARQKAIQNRAARTPAGKRNAKLYKQRNRHKVRARWTVENHKRAGKLKPEPCESCGAPKAQAHHEDYNNPLDVTWLCQGCHSKHHKRYAMTRPQVTRKTASTLAASLARRLTKRNPAVRVRTLDLIVLSGRHHWTAPFARLVARTLDADHGVGLFELQGGFYALFRCDAFDDALVLHVKHKGH